MKLLRYYVVNPEQSLSNFGTLLDQINVILEVTVKWRSGANTSSTSIQAFDAMLS
jgi:hypothetical protein